MSNQFTENDIRPEQLVKMQEKFCKQDIEFLQARKNQFLEVDCPACTANGKAHKFSKHTFNYVECLDCGMLYLSPRPTVEILNEFYPNSPNYKFFVTIQSPL